MADTRLYEDLARHLDQGILGTPTSPALLGILKILFPDQEAEIAVKLPMQNQTIAELKALYPEKEDSLEDIINSMVKRGTVFNSI